MKLRSHNTAAKERGFFHVSKKHADAPEVTLHEYSTAGLTSEPEGFRSGRKKVSES